MTRQLADSLMASNVSKTRGEAPYSDQNRSLESTHKGSFWSPVKQYLDDFANWWSAGFCMTVLVFAMVFFIYAGDHVL